MVDFRCLGPIMLDFLESMKKAGLKIKLLLWQLMLDLAGIWLKEHSSFSDPSGHTNGYKRVHGARSFKQSDNLN